MAKWSVVKERLGTVAVVLGLLLVGFLVWWNMFGQGPYRDTCRFSIGCRSYLCLEHALRGDEQVPATGRCTKACAVDASCGPGYRCVKLGAGARGDLPPFGKPTKACVRVLTP
jgi:hypothetical protein